jgi:large subunit ribosomal protein L40e
MRSGELIGRRKARAGIIAGLLAALLAISSPAFAEQFFVRTLSGKTFIVDVPPSESIDEVKLLIEDREGITPDKQKVIFNGRELLAGRTLSDYGVMAGATLYLFLQSDPLADSPPEIIDPAIVRARCVSELLGALTARQTPPLATYQCADIAGIEDANYLPITAKVLSLGDEARSDLGQVEVIVKRFVVIEKLSSPDSSRRVFAKDLVDIGLMGKTDPNKTAITLALRALPSSEIDSYEEVQVAIAHEVAMHKARKDRLTRLLERAKN